MKPHLIINMFEKFSIANDEFIIMDKLNRSKKMWELLGYLITNRDRAIPHSELIDLLWPEGESKNPSNALKVLVHRTRLTLEKLHLEKDISPILYYQNKYGWNPEILCTLDIDLFETACRKAENCTDKKERLALLMEAISIYKGEFLKDLSSVPWVMQTSTYYSTKFLKIAKEAVEILLELQQYDELINVCRKAISYAPYDESFYIYFLKTLLRTNQIQKALEQYQYISELFFYELGISPSEELVSIYKEIVKKNHSSEMDLAVIQKKIQEDYINGALLCKYVFFKTLYQIKARDASRGKDISYIGLLTALDSSGSDFTNQTMLNSIMDTLEVVVKSSMRQGDAFTRYSSNQFLLLLPNTTEKTSALVMQRIIENYRRQFPNISLTLEYSTQIITPPSVKS